MGVFKRRVATGHAFVVHYVITIPDNDGGATEFTELNPSKSRDFYTDFISVMNRLSALHYLHIVSRGVGDQTGLLTPGHVALCAVEVQTNSTFAVTMNKDQNLKAATIEEVLRDRYNICVDISLQQDNDLTEFH